MKSKCWDTRATDSIIKSGQKDTEASIITVVDISIGLTQCRLILGLIRDHFIMKLINLLIWELNNCSLGGDFQITRHAEMCQFDRFSLELNFKRAHSCNYGIPRLG